MHRLSLTFFESPRITLDGSPVELRRRKALALLAYLAVTGTPHTRDHLAELLYPQSSRNNARTGLRVQIAALNDGLGGAWISADRNVVSFSPAAGTSVDVCEFRRRLNAFDAIDAQGTATHESDPGTVRELTVAEVESLRAAADLYKGRFLSEFYLDDSIAFESWQEREAADLERAYVVCLEQLIRSAASGNDLALAIRYTRRLLALDPSDETIVRRLMGLEMDIGKPAKAIEQYEHLERHLRDELGTSPGADTEKLARRAHRCLTAFPDRWDDIPSDSTTFVGREAELVSLQDLVTAPARAPVTITGPPGVGKTRLAVELAAAVMGNFTHGAVFVDLATTLDPNSCMSVVGDTMRIRAAVGDPRALDTVVTAALSGRQVLIVMDNMEHLLPESADVAAALAAVPAVTVLATSREALRVRGETVLDLHPLSLPEPEGQTPGKLLAESVQMFADRMSAVAGQDSRGELDMGAVTAICRELDGLPLAIELAAAQARVLGPHPMLSGLQRSLDLLERGNRDAPLRHETMRRALDWSYEQLSELEKGFVARLSVFPGGFTMDGARAVCGELAEGSAFFRTFSSLVERNLIARTEQQARYRLLWVIREYLVEKLADRGDELDSRQCMEQYILDLVSVSAPMLRGPQQLATLRMLDEEYPNIRAILEQCEADDKTAVGVQIAGDLGYYWLLRGKYREARRWLEGFARDSGREADAADVARACYHLGWFIRFTDSTAFSFFAENQDAVNAFRIARDSAVSAGDMGMQALALSCLGWNDASEPDAVRHQRLDDAVELARASNDPWVVSNCLKWANSYLPRVDRTEEAKVASLKESIAIAEPLGDRYLLTQVVHGLGDVYMFIGKHEAAEPFYQRCLELEREIHDPFTVMGTMMHLAEGFYVRDDPRRMLRCCTEGLARAQECGSESFVGTFLNLCGVGLIKRGTPDPGLRLMGAASANDAFSAARMHDRFVTDESAEQLWNEGATLTREEAVSLALQAAESLE